MLTLSRAIVGLRCHCPYLVGLWPDRRPSLLNFLSEEIRRAAYAGKFHVPLRISANRFCSAVCYFHRWYAPQYPIWLYLIFAYSNWDRYPWVDSKYCPRAMLRPNVGRSSCFTVPH